MLSSSIWHSIRNWPRKFVSLHKTDRKIKFLQLAISQQALNIGSVILSTQPENNIYSFIKQYTGELNFKNARIKSDEIPYFLNMASDYCAKSFTTQLYSEEEITRRFVDNNAMQFIKELREFFLFPAELNMTANHSISRPFRFWQTDEKKNYINTALKIIQTLKELPPYCCFGYGTALAARRDGRLIPHDDDADILLYLPKTEGVNNRAEAVQLIAAFLKKKGYSIGWVTHIHFKVLAGKTKGIMKEIDVFLSLEGETPGSSKNAPRADWIPGAAEGFALDSLFPSRKIELEGIKIPCPRDTDTYLRTIYGETWQIPDDNFHYLAKDWRTE